MVEDLRGGDSQLNAQILMDVFGGQRGPVADSLNLNAGVALAACQLADDARDGIKMAQVHIDFLLAHGAEYSVCGSDGTGVHNDMP